MVNIEQSGLNLNSPIVQNMIAHWPKEKLERTKFYYGRPPTVETVGESAYDEQAKIEMNQINYAEREVERLMSQEYEYGKFDGSTLDAIRQLNADGAIPTSHMPVIFY